MIHKRTLKSLEFDSIIERLASHCASEAGRALALKSGPLDDAASVARACRLLEETAIWQARPGSFAIEPFPDVSGILASGSRPDLEAFWALRQTLVQARCAREAITHGQNPESWPQLLELAQGYEPARNLEAALDRCISDDGLLKDESSPELYRIRLELRRLHQNCLGKAREYASRYNILPYLQDEFITVSSDRYVLPIKASYKGRLQGIIHEYSNTGETCYFEPMFLVEINNSLQRLKQEEHAEEQAVLAYLAGLLDSEAAGVTGSVNLLARLDLIQGTLRLGAELDGRLVAPGSTDEGVSLLEARHPLLLLQRKDRGGEPVRPLDIILEPGDRALVVTGGNAGGKTVCLKTMGLIAAMAMSGLPVPAGAGSHLPWFNRVDAFIGDEQSLSDNVSTFTAQIEHLARAWKHLDGEGLVLLDEFGAGTDPAQGSALAQGLLDELLEKGVFTLAATHFPALKSYALSREGCRAASMLFDPKSLKPLFRLAYGQVGASQALDVARSHGLPQEIIHRAEHYLLQDGEETGRLLERLNDLAARREHELEQLRAERKRARAEEKRLCGQIAAEREKLAVEIRLQIRELMRAWREGRASARQSLKEMGALRESIFGGGNKRIQDSTPAALDIGQRVMHRVLNRPGFVRELDRRRQRARLEMDGVGMWAAIADISPLANAPAARLGGFSRGAAISGTAPMRIDVRGQRGDECLKEIERFLDRAILAGYSEVEIIHGRGTGALRRQIHEFLGVSPAADSFALAPEDQGGDGMTIVALR